MRSCDFVCNTLRKIAFRDSCGEFYEISLQAWPVAVDRLSTGVLINPILVQE